MDPKSFKRGQRCHKCKLYTVKRKKNIYIGVAQRFRILVFVHFVLCQAISKYLNMKKIFSINFGFLDSY